MPLNKAYVAGLFDGEGCVRFGRVRGNLFPVVLVTNTNLEVLEALQAQYGGDIRPLWGRKPGWKQGYTWRLSWSRAVEFLDAIQPWLIVKRDQAATAFAWDAARPGNGRKWDAETADLLVRRMRWLNTRGPRTEPDPIDEVLAHAA